MSTSSSSSHPSYSFLISFIQSRLQSTLVLLLTLEKTDKYLDIKNCSIYLFFLYLIQYKLYVIFYRNTIILKAYLELTFGTVL